MPTFIQPPEPEEEHQDTSGKCISVESHDKGCFSVSAFDQGCFYINHFPAAGYSGPPAVVIEDKPLVFTGLHVQGSKLLILDGATNTMYDYIWSFDKINNVIWASGKSTHGLTGITDDISDIYSDSNIHSSEDVFVGLTEDFDGARGQWVSPLTFHASSSFVVGHVLMGETGDVRIPTSSEPSTLTQKIGCVPPGDGLTHRLTVNQRYLQNKDALKRVVSAMGRITYEYLGDNYYDTADLPARTVANVSDFHHVQTSINYYHSIGNALVAGFGHENNPNITDDYKVAVLVGGDLGTMTYERYETTYVEGEQVVTTCIYQFVGWNTQKHIVFPDLSNIVAYEVAWYLSTSHIVIMGKTFTQTGTEQYGLHYYKYDDAPAGRSESVLSFIEVEWDENHPPVDMTLADDIFLYAVEENSETVLKAIPLN